MSKGGKPGGDIFDVARIRQIVELMEQHELAEIDLQQGDEKIKLTRGGGAFMPALAAAPLTPTHSAPPPAAPATGQPATGQPAEDTAGTITINAPMVGTFYARPNPEAEAFVKVGSIVNEETVVCIVEAMKVFNEIPAECRGKIVEVLAEDQQPVDFGKPLFRVQPTD